MATRIDVKTEGEILGFITCNLTDLLKPKGPGPANPGICEYNLVTAFGSLSANEIRDYLVDLERRGKLRDVGRKRSDGLMLPASCYIPVEDR